MAHGPAGHPLPGRGHRRARGEGRRGRAQIAGAAPEILRLHLGSLASPGGHKDRWPVHGFVLKLSRTCILVDTGIGGPAAWLSDWRTVDRTAAEALGDHDLTPSDISLVINTHLHFDHCGQNAVFRHAPFVLQRTELDRARLESKELTDWFDFAGAKFELLDGPAELGEGVQVLPTPGHTAGHQSVLVETAGGTSVLIGDAAYTPRQYADPHTQELPEGQAADRDAWTESLRRLRSLEPDHVHFCHATEVLHHPKR